MNQTAIKLARAINEQIGRVNQEEEELRKLVAESEKLFHCITMAKDVRANAQCKLENLIKIIGYSAIEETARRE